MGEMRAREFSRPLTAKPGTRGCCTEGSLRARVPAAREQQFKGPRRPRREQLLSAPAAHAVGEVSQGARNSADDTGLHGAKPCSFVGLQLVSAGFQRSETLWGRGRGEGGDQRAVELSSHGNKSKPHLPLASPLPHTPSLPV